MNLLNDKTLEVIKGEIYVNGEKKTFHMKKDIIQSMDKGVELVKSIIIAYITSALIDDEDNIIHVIDNKGKDLLEELSREYNLILMNLDFSDFSATRIRSCVHLMSGEIISKTNEITDKLNIIDSKLMVRRRLNQLKGEE